MPIVHWPTFSQQLVAREDEKSETWRAFLLSLGTAFLNQKMSKLTRSDILHHPASKIRINVPAGQGTAETTSKMSYRVEEVTESAIRRGHPSGRFYPVVSSFPRSGDYKLTHQLRPHIPRNAWSTSRGQYRFGGSYQISPDHCATR
jgi:hypothetical protein